MKICVIGLGVVGLVSSMRLCEKGRHVTGIDISPSLIDSLNKGILPFSEPNLEIIFKKHLHKKFIIDDYSCLKEHDVFIICVNTPCLDTGNIDLSKLYAVVARIKKESPRPIIIRSTIPPQTTEFCFKQDSPKWPVVYYPEFLRQENAWNDSTNPSLNIYALLGTDGKWFESLFDVDNSWRKTHIRTAEYIKYMNNSFHALKVVFANEINVLGNTLGVDMNEAHQLFISDHDLNISDKYLRPGLPFGGHCLGKDTKILSHLMKQNEISAPLVEAIHTSNLAHHQRILDQLNYNSKDLCGFIRLNSKKWGTSHTNPVLNLAKRIKNSCIWEPDLDQCDISPVKKEDSLDCLLEKSKKLIITISEKDPSFWDKIHSSKADIFIFDKNQIPYPFQKKTKFHLLRGDIVY